MITFKNIAGNKFLAVGTIQRKSALNGEKSLTGTLYDGDDVLNKIDKGWSLEFDNEPYIVTYFERNDNDNSVSFDAIHKFFWDMAKNVLYSETSGSHTIKWYLDQIFANTGYSYALNFNPNAIAKDNWGMKNKLSLFNDVITSIEGEFEINGTLISIFKNIGTDLSTIVRYGFNLSDMTIENDASGFVTYGEGFGAYADQENMTGDRLHVTYTSPLASVYGKLQAEPIDDQRYTIESNLLDAVKSQVGASFSISVNLSLYDLSVAGYPYKMANVGDWLTAVDENIDFKQRIRIISIDDAFAADGTRISYSVTAGDIGLTKKYQDANASIANKVEDAVISAGQAATDANIALIAANGKNKSYYLNDINDLPKTANEGDLAWVQSGDGRVLYIYTKKADGTYYWEKRIDPEMGKQIEAGVTDAVTQAKAHTDEVKQGLSTDITTATSQAASLASTAEANAKSAATSQFNQAQNALSAAKTDLTNSIASEASDRAAAVAAANSQAQNALSAAKTDLTNSIASEASARNQAVAAANSQAQTYANQAKADALNTIAKEVTDRQNAVSALDTKATNAVNQAKSDINDTINAISVGDRNYILDTANPKTQTSNGKDNQDFRGQATFYSPIKNWGIANADYIISFDWTLKTAPSSDMNAGVFFDQSPWQPQNFTVKAGQLTGHVDLKFKLDPRLLIATIDVIGLTFRIMSQMDSGNTITYSNLFMKSGTISTTWTPAPEDVVLDYTTKDNQIKETITQYQTDNDGKVTKAQTDATTALGQVATKVSQTDYDTKTGDLTTKYTQVKQTTDSQAADIVDIKKTATSQDSKINSISSDVDGTKQSISDIETTQNSQSDKINQITSDVNGTKQSITDIQTKDGKQDTRMGTIETSVSGVKSDFSTYKTDANGRIGTAQTTAQTAVDGLRTKVSQTDYNTKTGQLQTDLTTTTQTANQAKTDIVSIKQKDGDQDSRMTRIESDASGVKTTVSDLQTAQGKQSGDISTLQQRADGFDATVTKVDNLVVGGRNLLLGTATPWTIKADGSNWYYNSIYDHLKGGTTYTFSAEISVSNGQDSVTVAAYDAPIVTGWAYSDNFSKGVKRGSFTFTTPDHIDGDGHFIIYAGTLGKTAGLSATYTHMKLEEGNLPTDWTPAPEDGEQATAKAQLTADTARTEISNYKTDADGRISKAQSDITQTANQVATKVSQSDYNTKTGQLTTDVNSVTQTANQSKQDIVSIKQKDSDQDARMNTIESDASGTKQTVSNIQTNQGQQDASITTLQTRADGIETNISKAQTSINDLQQINQITNSEFTPDFAGWHSGNDQQVADETSDVPAGWYRASGRYNNSTAIGNQLWVGVNGIHTDLIPVGPTQQLSGSAVGYSNPDYDGSVTLAIDFAYYDSSKKLISSNRSQTAVVKTWTKIILQAATPANTAYVSFAILTNGSNGVNYYSQPMLVFSNTLGSYVQGSYNNNVATAKAQLTADNAALAVGKLTSADGVITKAQADIQANADAITQKVSKTDYDQKTGDLTQAVSKAQTTADGAVSTVGNYQTSNDKRVSDAESKIEQNSKDITARVSQTDYDKKTGELSGYISTLQQRADGFDATVTKVDNLSVGGRNLLLGTATPWTIKADGSNWYYNSIYDHLKGGTTYTFSAEISVSNGQDSVTVAAYDAPIVTGWAYSDNFSKGVKRGSFTFTTPDHIDGDGHFIIYAGTLGKTAGLSATYTYMKLEEGNVPTAWTPAPEDVQSDISQVKITADGINNFVRDSSGNISSNFQTALSKTSIVSGSTLASSIQTQTSSQISSAITDNNGRIISLINQDKSGVQIAGKNIILDGNVTVTNAFTVGQANIANGAIGTAQIGDASITSAKIIDLDVSRLTGNTTQFIKSNWDSAYSNVSIDPDSILLNAKSGSTTLTSVSIGSLGMKIEMPGMASFLSDTMINSGGIAFHHAGGTYGSFGMLGNGFTTQYSPTGGAPLGITVGDGRNNDAANMAFGISVSQYAGQAPQLIWAGANTGKVSSSYRTWDNPAGFIIADNIKFSTWDNTASIVEFDSTITYRNWAPDQKYGYIDSTGTRRWFKVSGYNMSPTNRLVGIFGGDGANGIAFDQTGDVWFSNKGNSYSLHDMLAKLNML